MKDDASVCSVEVELRNSGTKADVFILSQLRCPSSYVLLQSLTVRLLFPNNFKIISLKLFGKELIKLEIQTGEINILVFFSCVELKSNN